MTKKKTTSNVRVKGEITQVFEIKTGLRQGDPLSTLLFNKVLENIIVVVVGYADDVTITARTERELK